MGRNQRTDALIQRAHQEQREKAARLGEVVVYFHERQRSLKWWQRETPEHSMRVYSDSRAEIRSTNRHTFLVVIITTPEGIVEHSFNWNDVKRLVTAKAS